MEEGERSRITRVEDCFRVSPSVRVTLHHRDHGVATLLEGVECSCLDSQYRCTDPSNKYDGNCGYRVTEKAGSAV